MSDFENVRCELGARLAPIEPGLLKLGFHDSSSAEPGSIGEEAGDSIGRYRLIELLGTGGFGNVWLAEQTEPIRRQVALKLIKPGMDSREIIARFEAERQALALMDHPNIAAVVDAGTTTSGRPYFVLELVRGEPITAYCDVRQLSIPQRIDLFISVCQAVQHAHQKAILHRDLKPSNILVTEVDGKPVPKIIDFGIAKAMGNNLNLVPDSSWMRTQAGAIIGTPHYMSPEQAGSVPDVDTRSDIYALGVILYELLTGSTPLVVEAGGMQFEDLLRFIREQDAPLPSARVSGVSRAIAEARKVDPARLSKMLRGDLDWIALRALEKDRRRRYETATALAQDLQAHRQQEPVSAAAPTWSYRFGKFARRHRAALVTTFAVAVALLGGIVVSLWQASRANKSRVEAEKNFERAKDAVELFLSRATDHPVLGAPEFQELRLQLVMHAIPFYEEIASATSNDPKIRSHQAWALSRAANLYFQSGDVAKADAAIGKAIALDEQLVAEFPENVDFRRGFALRLHNLGVIVGALGKRAERASFQQRAVEIFDRLCAGDPKNPTHRRELVSALTSLVLSWKELGRLPEAEAAVRRASELQKALVTEFPDDQKNRSLLATLRTIQGRILADRKDFAEADRLYREAIALRNRLFAENPRDVSCREPLALDCASWGNTLCEIGRGEEGEKLMRRALLLYEGLAQEFPERPGYRREGTVCRYNTGVAIWKMDRREEGLALCEAALQSQESLIAKYAENQKLRETTVGMLGRVVSFCGELNRWEVASRHLAKAIEIHEPLFVKEAASRRQKKIELLSDLVEAHIKLGQHAEAVARAWEAATMNPDKWEPWYWAAEIVARSHELAQKDTRLTENARIETLEMYTQRMITLLRQAVANGCTSVPQFPERMKIAWLLERSDFTSVAALDPSAIESGTNVDRSPSRFTFEYRGSDPGKRSWVRDGDTWTETQPSGKANVHQIGARIMVNGVPGSELRAKKGTTRLFVPDLGTPEPLILRIRTSTGVWGHLGSIENVQ